MDDILKACLNFDPELGFNPYYGRSRLPGKWTLADCWRKGETTTYISHDFENIPQPNTAPRVQVVYDDLW